MSGAVEQAVCQTKVLERRLRYFLVVVVHGADRLAGPRAAAQLFRLEQLSKRDHERDCGPGGWRVRRELRAGGGRVRGV